MTTTKDWMQEASNEITAQQIELGRLSRVNVPAIIAKHSPFKENVAYMPVPRCETCGHWTRNRYDASNGSCVLTEGSDGGGSASTYSDSKAYATVGGDEFDVPVLYTRVDFGCVQWKAKQ